MISTNLTRCRILVVDSNVESLALIVEFFRSYSLDLIATTTAGDAVTQAELFQPHAIYMGLEYEDCDGWELAVRLRRVPGLAQVMLFGLVNTGFDWRTMDSAGSHGFDYYFPKPPRIEDIVMALTNAAAQC